MSTLDLDAPPQREAALGGLTLHEQIAQHLRERILDGRYAPLAQVPSETALCASFEVSRVTVRQALAALQSEGLIFKRQGKGSFVARPKSTQDVTQLAGLAEALASQGHQVLNRVLSLGEGRADAQAAQKLALPLGAPVVILRRVRLIDRVPVSLEVTVLPGHLLAVLQRADLVQRDVFEVLENDAGLALGHADLTIGAAPADALLAEHLPLAPGMPVLHIERLTHDAAGRPIDHEHLWYCGDAFQYRLRAERRIDRRNGARRPTASLQELVR